MKASKAKVQKITSLLCTLALVFTVSVTASAQEAPVSGSITSAKTPVSSAIVSQKWANKYFTMTAGYESNACGTPLAVGNYIYVTDSSSGKLLKLDAATGATVKSVPCSNIPPYFSQLAYGDGKIYVPQQTKDSHTNKLTVQISAFDADTLAPAWQSDAIKSTKGDLQIASPITYYDQHIYFGTYVYGTPYSGVYVCLDTKSRESVWQYKNDSAGYYWAGSTIAGNAIVFGDSAGNLTSLNLQGGALKSKVALGSSISSTPCFSNGKVYVSTTDGNLVSVPLKSDSTFDSAAKISTKLGDNITSSPVVCNGRVYVAGGGNGVTTPFSVLNADTLKVIYQIKEIHSQSTPLISTAYATTDNHQQVYIYVTNFFDGTTDPATYESTYNADSSCTYLIKDSANQTTASYEKLTNVSVPQYCSQSVIASDAGWLYYYNDGGNLFAFAPIAPTQTPASNTVVPNSAISTATTPVKGMNSVSSTSAHNAETGDHSTSVLFFAAAAVSAAILCKAKAKKKQS